MLNRSRTYAAPNFIGRRAPGDLCDWDGAPVSAVVGVRRILQAQDE